MLALIAASAGAQEKASAPGPCLIASAPNLRDLGGYATRDGSMVRKNLLFRSGMLGRISPDDQKKLDALGLKADFDLRLPDEQKAQPDKLPAGIKVVSLNVLADGDRSATARLSRFMQKPLEANTEFGNGKAEAMIAENYRQLVSLPSARRAYRQLFVDLSQEANLPAVFHCSSGKDRTGWAAAALLTLLGVAENTVMEDYLRSNNFVLPGYQKSIDEFTKAGGDPALASAILGVKPDYLKAAFDEMKSKYGSIEGYFTKGLGIDAAGQKALRDRFLSRRGD